MAQIASVFGCRVIYYSASGKNHTADFEEVDFETLLAESDILSLHCPLTEQTRHMMNAQAFAKMKKDRNYAQFGKRPRCGRAGFV